MAISQQDRLNRIATPLEETTFVVQALTGIESLSRPFIFDLHPASEKEATPTCPRPGSTG